MLLSLYRFLSRHPLTSLSKTSSFFRYVKYQFLKRINKSYDFKFIGKTRLLLTPNDTSGYGCAYSGLLEFEDQSFLLHFLRENDLFVDIGANTGIYTILASGVNAATTIAIEPIPSILKLLENNVKHNKLDSKVELLGIGVGSKKAKSLFAVNGAYSQISEKQTDNTLSINIDTLDNLLVNKINVPTIFKMDVEGYELEVLKGGEASLNNQLLKAVIIEININGMADFGYDFETLDNVFQKSGFKMHLYEPFTRKLYEASLDDVLKTSNNGIYIRDLEFVNDRITKALKFEVLGYEI